MRAGAASAARWARCRNAHCSLWARNLNANLQFHRGLAAAPLLRLAAEPMPISGFVEQRSCGASLVSNLCASGEEADSLDGGVAAAQAIAVILDGVAKLDGSISSRFAEMLDTSVLIMYKCCGGLSHNIVSSG
ncbi:BXL6 [Symbiodinium natans]|uniref:BXL6 protein n=1 Tax=Symbiodinium natans TaxID=878477 RepID=A0A812TVB9_9DINO|nr:BXL6 [Symbiodinium natans]